MCFISSSSHSLMQGSELFALDCPSSLKFVPVGPLYGALIFERNTPLKALSGTDGWGSHNPLCTTKITNVYKLLSYTNVNKKRLLGKSPSPTCLHTIHRTAKDNLPQSTSRSTSLLKLLSQTHLFINLNAKLFYSVVLFFLQTQWKQDNFLRIFIGIFIFKNEKCLTHHRSKG